MNDRQSVFTIRSPRWFDRYWESVRAGHYQPYAIAAIAAVIALGLVSPWVIGIITIFSA